jgi:transposase
MEQKNVLESTGNMWMRVHDTLEDNGIDTILANTYKTKIIAQAKIKSDKLDARILSDSAEIWIGIRIICTSKVI